MKVVNIDEEVFNMIKSDCYKELLRHHPDLIKVNLSMNKILYHVCKHYIECGNT